MSVLDVEIPRKVWTRADVEKIDPALAESLELINGELIDTRGKKPPRVYWSHTLRDWLAEQFGSGYVRSEAPIGVSAEDNPTNEPEPDLTLTFEPRRAMRGHHPQPQNIRLLVEISDATYLLDTKVKANLYARAGIREYWVIDIRDPETPRLLTHRDPQNGCYLTRETHTHLETVLVLEDRRLCLGDFL